MLTNPFFPPASRTGNLGITTLNFLKSWTSGEIHLSRNSAGTIATFGYLYCSHTGGLDGALWPFWAGETCVLEKQGVVGWGAAQPGSHSTKDSHRSLATGSEPRYWYSGLPSSQNQNLVQTDFPHLPFPLFHTCILFWEQTLTSSSRILSQPHDHLTWQSSVLIQYLTSIILHYVFYSCYFCLPQCILFTSIVSIKLLSLLSE